MKKLLLIISVLLSINIILAQEKKDTLTYLTISDDQSKFWREIEDKWEADYFNPFLEKHKLKTSCARCASIHFQVVFALSEKGEYKALLKSNNVCGGKFTKKQEAELLISLNKIVFPKEFYNAIFLFGIGHTLKC